MEFVKSDLAGCSSSSYYLGAEASQDPMALPGAYQPPAPVRVPLRTVSGATSFPAIKEETESQVRPRENAGCAALRSAVVGLA